MRIGIGILAMMVLGLLTVGCSVSKVAEPEAATEAPVETVVSAPKEIDGFETISEGVYLSKTESTSENIVMIVSGDEVALVDPIDDEATLGKVRNFVTENQFKLSYVVGTNTKRSKGYKKIQDLGAEMYSPLLVKESKSIQMGDKNINIRPVKGFGDGYNLVVLIDGKLLVSGDLIAKESMIVESTFGSYLESIEDIDKEAIDIIVQSTGVIESGEAVFSGYANRLREISKVMDVETVGTLSKVDDYVFISSGSYHRVNITLVVSGDECAVIDAGNNEAEAKAIMKYIEENNLKLKHLMITHKHSDHMANFDMFQLEGVQTTTYDELEANEENFAMGDVTFTLIKTPGHFNNEHMSVLINDEILVAGDIINSLLKPADVLQYGGNKEDLLVTLAELNKRQYKYIISGHGEIMIGNTAIYNHIKALNEL